MRAKILVANFKREFELNQIISHYRQIKRKLGYDALSPVDGKKKLITIPASSVTGSANLNDFPALIHLGDDSDIVSALGSSDGSDIFFTNLNGERLPHELVSTGNFVTYSGGWTWFCYPQAVYSSSQNKSYIGFLAASGEYGVACYDHASGVWTHGSFTAAWGLIPDDHNCPVLYVRTDGKIVAVYAPHGTSANTEVRISTNAGDVTSWGAATSIAHSVAVTYTQLHYLPTSGSLIFLCRAGGSNSYYMVTSSDEGSTWGSPVEVWNPTLGGGNGYVITRNDGDDRIDLICNDSHPNNGGTKVYHSYYNGTAETWYKTDGTAMTLPFGPTQQTTGSSLIFTATGTDTVWISDVQYDGTNIHVLFYNYKGAYANHVFHELHYARYASGAWSTVKVCDESKSTNRYGVGRDTSEKQYPAVGQFYDGDETQLLTGVLDENEDYQITRFYTADSGTSWTKGEQLTNGEGFDSFRPRRVHGQTNDELQWVWLGNGLYRYYSNVATPLAYWNTAIRCYPSVGHAYEYAWVKLSLNPDTDNFLNVHYGSGVPSDNDSTEVWSNYEYVCHLSLGPNDNNQEWTDSTGNRQGVVQRNSFSPKVQSGLPGVLMRTPFDSHAGLNIGPVRLENQTLLHQEALVYWTANGANPHTIFDNQTVGGTAGTAVYAKMQLDPSDNTVDGQVLQSSDTAWPATPSASAVVSQGSLHQLYFGFDSSSATSRTRVDSNEYTTTEATGVLDFTINTNDMHVGVKYDPIGTAYSNPYNGWLSEVRMGFNVLSKDWTDTQYTNISDVDGFCTFGSEEDEAGELNYKSSAGAVIAKSNTAFKIGKSAIEIKSRRARVNGAFVGPQNRQQAKRVTRNGINAAKGNRSNDVTAHGFGAARQCGTNAYSVVATGVLAGAYSQGQEGAYHGDYAGCNYRDYHGCFSGFKAGMSSKGIGHTATGWNAGYGANASFGAFHGYRAGRLANAVNLTGVGAYALENCTGSGSTASGFESGQNATGSAGTYSGYRAGKGNTGNNCTLMGSSVGISNTANDLSAFGVGAAGSNTGANVSCFGVNSGGSNTAAGLTATGVQAGQNNSGDNSTFGGYLAGLGNTKATVTGNGYQAARANTGNNLTASGALCGMNNVGNNGTASGYQALYGNTAHNATAMGMYAGNGNTGANGSFFGYLAGNGNTRAKMVIITDGNRSVFEIEDGLVEFKVDPGGTPATPGTVADWLKVKMNGTTSYIPLYV